MKKLFLILAVSALFLIVGCGDGSKKVDNADSGETVTDEDGDTADEEPADDSEPADTEPAEDSDKDGGDSADDSGDSGDSKPDEDPTPEPTEADQCVAVGGTWSWDGTEGSCAKTVSCKKITAKHAEWNGEEFYVQKYADGKWSAEVPTKYDEKQGDCHFKCAVNYAWNGKECLPECNIVTTDFPCYDPESKLTWSEKYLNMTWEEAYEYCKDLNKSNYGGYSSGWYLPNIDELKTLIAGWSKDDSCKVSEENNCLAYGECWTNDINCKQSCKEVDGSVRCIPDPKFSKFGDGQHEEYMWSSSIESDYPNYAWIIYSYYGSITDTMITNQINFRCVWIEPDEVVTECAGKGGIWDRSQKKCIEIPCPQIPASAEHTEWNGDGTYTQEYDYDNHKWIGEASPKYGYEEEGCYYICASGYGWNGTNCEQFLANEADVKPVPEGQDNTNGAECDSTTFVEFCDGNTAVYCTGTVNRQDCDDYGSSERICMTTVGLYSSYGSKNYAWCYTSCETPGGDGDPKSCSETPVDDYFVGTEEFYMCLKTSKGNLYFNDSPEVQTTTKQCTTPCDASGDRCLPECGKGSDTPCYDSESGLTWSDKAKNDSGGYVKKTWTEADTYCRQDLTEGGYEDWRLPTIDELKTLLVWSRAESCKVSEETGNLSHPDDWSCSTCTENGIQAEDSNDCSNWGEYNTDGTYSKLGDTENGYFWSSSLLSSDDVGAWSVMFSYGGVYGYGKSGSAYVRCVR